MRQTLKTIAFVKHAARLGLCAWAAMAATSPAQAQLTEQDWSRHFRIGLQVGLNMKVDFSMSGSSPTLGTDPGPAGVPGANHRYDDGYVLVDDTGNAEGYTSYWGYSSASQHDSEAQTLTFHSAGSFTAGGAQTTETEMVFGLDMVYGVNLTQWKSARVGIDLGFGLLPLSVKDNRPLNGSFNRTVHQFDTGDIVIPTAPYNGGQSGIGPTIHDTATALDDDTIGGTITGTRTLDATFYSVRLGPTLHWELHRRVALSAGAGVALGILSGEYRINETLQLADGSTQLNKGTIDGTDVTFGGYVTAALLFHIERNGDLYITAQYMPMGDAEISGHGRQARLRTGESVYLAAGVNWAF